MKIEVKYSKHLECIEQSITTHKKWLKIMENIKLKCNKNRKIRQKLIKKYKMLKIDENLVKIMNKTIKKYSKIGQNSRNIVQNQVKLNKIMKKNAKINKSV